MNKTTAFNIAILTAALIAPNIDARQMLRATRRNTQEKETTSNNYETLIIGGTTAARDEFPFFTRVDNYHRSWCGGTLIRPDIVMTAAHCEADIAAYSTIVNAYSMTDRFHDGHIEVDVIERIAHPLFTRDTMEYDVALLKLAQPVLDVNIVPLNDNAQVPAIGETLTIIGLGNTQESAQSLPSELQKTQVDMMEQEQCKNIYKPWIVPNDTMMCAMKTGGGQDACRGDSGGPILTANGVQVGIISWGVGCASAQYPGVYTRISGVKQWIDETLCTFSAYGKDACPSDVPSTAPTSQPSTTSMPSVSPSFASSLVPSGSPSLSPSTVPPSLIPSLVPSESPSSPSVAAIIDSDVGNVAAEDTDVACEDKEGKEFRISLGGTATCSDISSLSFFKRFYVCLSGEVSQTCPFSCGACRGDGLGDEGPGLVFGGGGRRQ